MVLWSFDISIGWRLLDKSKFQVATLPHQRRKYMIPTLHDQGFVTKSMNLLFDYSLLVKNRYMLCIFKRNVHK